MSKKMTDEISPQDHGGSIEAVLAAIEELRGELNAGRTDDWENPTLERFLEAMHAWLTTTAPRVSQGHPSWTLVEQMIRMAKVYE